MRYEYSLEFEHGGDLVSVLHVVGFTDFRFCYEIRDRILVEEIRWEARGGEYLLRLIGADFEDVHLLRPGANATGWYEHAVVHEIQVAGLSAKHKPTLIVSEPPPMTSSRVAPAIT